MSELTYPERMLETLRRGAPIYGIVRHVSPSGMSKVVDMIIIVHDFPYSLAGLAINGSAYRYKIPYTYDSHRAGFQVEAAGMDTITKLTHDIGRVVHGDCYYFRSFRL
jgi:hypothetical protein